MTIANHSDSTNGPLVKYHSEKLFKLVERNWPNELDILEEIFKIAIEFGGIEEHGYTRESGSSFNPRSARIPLIAYEVGKICSWPSIAAAIIFSGTTCGQNFEIVQQRCKSFMTQDAIRQLVDLINLEDIILSQRKLQLEKYSMDSLIINLCSILDRVRHSHLAEERERELALNIFPYVIKLVPENLVSLEMQFKTWHNRAMLNREISN